jgi:hypothetical protein
MERSIPIGSRTAARTIYTRSSEEKSIKVRVYIFDNGSTVGGVVSVGIVSSPAVIGTVHDVYTLLFHQDFIDTTSVYLAVSSPSYRTRISIGPMSPI